MNQNNKTLGLAYIAVCAVLIAICSWISIPTVVPFTLQTFAVFLSVILLGGKRGTAAIVIYILLGAVGIPVFAGFSAGAGILLGTTGGYIIGFIATALIMWLFETVFGKGMIPTVISMILGLIACYAIGTVWFIQVYGRNNGAIGVGTALAWCVTPFILPDCIKMVLALAVGKRLGKALHQMQG